MDNTPAVVVSCIAGFFMLGLAAPILGPLTLVAGPFFSLFPSKPDAGRSLRQRFAKAVGAGLLFCGVGAVPRSLFVLASMDPLSRGLVPEQLALLRFVDGVLGVIGLGTAIVWIAQGMAHVRKSRTGFLFEEIFVLLRLGPVGIWFLGILWIALSGGLLASRLWTWGGPAR